MNSEHDFFEFTLASSSSFHPHNGVWRVGVGMGGFVYHKHVVG